MMIITLTTDFGLKDNFAGIVKGVIFSICSKSGKRAEIVDITHLISRHDIKSAAFSIYASYRYFPEQTVHLAVVDPGVGSLRNIIAFFHEGHFFVGPDNGLFTLLLEDGATPVVVDADYYALKNCSSTFHGRDVFAPIAANLAMLADIGKLKKLEIPDFNPVKFDFPKISFWEGKLRGVVIYIDVFGNLITNIGNEYADKYKKLSLNGIVLSGVTNSYSDKLEGEPLFLKGSFGFIEIAVSMGSAMEFFNANAGDEVIMF